MDLDDGEHGLIMPFVVCKTQGGTLDDLAFVVGWELGQIDGELEMCETLYATPRSRYVHTVGVPQLDLISMRRGYLLKVSETDESGEWTWVEFNKPNDGDDDE